MNEPSNGVPPALLPHLHLVSEYSYPILTSVSLDTIVEYLLQAPKITRELAAMSWRYLDSPRDGTVMLVWQPLNQLGTQFASDGYVWADVENAFSSEAHGYTVEMYIHRSGYSPPREVMATHCRRRYRLMPPKVPNPNLPPCDPSLWIVHYSSAEPQNHFPANRIPILPQVRAILAQREYLQQRGQLVRKEFMLNDRNNWPTLNLPGGRVVTFAKSPEPRTQKELGQTRGRQEQSHQQPPSLPGGARTSPSHTSKRRRRSGSRHGRKPSVEVDEDFRYGDLMDFLTPREISLMRYKQHHEWMEEVFSVYSTDMLSPVDLGLGREGELKALTRGFFEAPTGSSLKFPVTDKDKVSTRRTDDDDKDFKPFTITVPSLGPPGDVGRASIGKMEGGKAKDFTRRATKKIAQMKAEIETMRQQHAQRMEENSRSSHIKDAEIRLRSAIHDPSNTGTEMWRLEGQLAVPTDLASGEANMSTSPILEKVDDIVKEVEMALGKNIAVVQELVCIQKGGLEEKTVNDSSERNGEVFKQPLSNERSVDEDVHMEDSSDHLVHRADTSTSTPAHPPSARQGGLPGSPEQSVTIPVGPRTDELSKSSLNIGAPNERVPSNNDDAMAGTANVDGHIAMPAIPKEHVPDPGVVEPEDWVLVDRSGEDTVQAPSADLADGVALDNPSTAPPNLLSPGGFIGTPGSGVQGMTPQAPQQGQEGFIAEQLGQLEELDTAGAALAGYDAPIEREAELEGSGIVDMDTSAFGDALHGIEPAADAADVTPQQ